MTWATHGSMTERVKEIERKDVAGFPVRSSWCPPAHYFSEVTSTLYSRQGRLSAPRLGEPVGKSAQMHRLALSASSLIYFGGAGLKRDFFLHSPRNFKFPRRVAQIDAQGPQPHYSPVIYRR